MSKKNEKFVSSQSMLGAMDRLLRRVVMGEVVYITRPSGSSIMRLRLPKDGEVDELRNMTMNRFKSFVEEQQTTNQILTKSYSLNSSDLEAVGKDLVLEPVMPAIDESGEEVHPTEIEMPGTRLKNQRDIWWDMLAEGKVRLTLTRKREAEVIVAPIDSIDVTSINKKFTKSETYGLVSGGGVGSMSEGDIAIIQDRNRSLEKPKDLAVMYRASSSLESRDSASQQVSGDNREATPVRTISSEGVTMWSVGDVSLRRKKDGMPFAEEVKMLSDDGIRSFYIIHHVAPEGDAEGLTHEYNGEQVVLSQRPPGDWKEQRLSGGNKIWLPVS